MSGDKPKKATPALQVMTGEIVIKPYATGSKSEHDAVFIQSTNGTFLLRKLGGNPFHDPALEKLKGKQVKVTGRLDNNLFLAKDIEEIL